MAAFPRVRECAGMDTYDSCAWTLAFAVPPAGGPSRVALARATEGIAAEHLARVHGLVTVARNLRVAVDDLRGELDVVAEDRVSGLLVVCEVKARTREPRGRGLRPEAAEMLGARQRARIRRMTAVLLADGSLRARAVRFDLVTVDLGGDGDERRGHVARCRHLAGAW